MEATPRFLNGVFSFEGSGYDSPQKLADALTYTVPPDKRSQLIYFRAGNSCGELVYIVLTRDGKPMRYFPIGAKAHVHVPLAVVEDIFPETRLEVMLAAPPASSGQLVLDIGLLEI
jgi:assimilatory nitrate reductase catalytic subunit